MAVSSLVKPGNDGDYEWLTLFAVSEQRCKPLFASSRKVDDAAARRGVALGPFEFRESRHHGSAQRAGQMMPALAPVEAGLAHRTARVGQRVGVDLQGGCHEPLALAGQFDRLLAFTHQPLLFEAVEHLHAEIAGQMIVANSRPPQRRILWPGPHAHM